MLKAKENRGLAGRRHPDGAKEAVLGSLHITLSPQEDMTLPGNGGEALHGLFLRFIARRDPELATRLHHMKGPKPFSLSPLQGCQTAEGRSFLTADKPYSFQLSLLETDLLAVATAAFFEAQVSHEALTLGRAQVEIKEVEAKGSTGSSFLSFRDLLAQTSQENQLALQFLSPTAFRVKGKNFLFPLPYLVFSSLLQHWDAFSGLPLSSCLGDCLDSMVVSRYQLQTELVSFSRFKWIGFKGYAVYSMSRELSPSQIRALNCLADFAFYSGVGWKTTMGMGQTRRIGYARSLPDGTGGDPEKRRGPAGSDQG